MRLHRFSVIRSRCLGIAEEADLKCHSGKLLVPTEDFEDFGQVLSWVRFVLILITTSCSFNQSHQTTHQNQAQATYFWPP